MLKFLFSRRTATQLNEYTGVSGEIVIDTVNMGLRVYNGVTQGGYKIYGNAELSSLIGTLSSQVSDDTADLTDIENTLLDIESALDDKLDLIAIGAASGAAPLDANAKVPLSVLPIEVVGQLSYQGIWNATANTPELPAANTVKGHYYVVSVAGTYASIDFAIGDWVVSDGTNWDLVKNTDAIASVAGKTGVITLVKSDVGLDNVDNTSDANKPVSTAQQAALDLKADIDSPILTGEPAVPTQLSSDDSARIASTAFVQTLISETPHGVSSVEGTDPIEVDNTNPAQPTISVKEATTELKGALSASDKAKLNNIEAGAQVNTVDSVASKTGAVELVKADVGLGNVENYPVATQVQHEEATVNTAYAVPLGVRQFMEGLGFEEY